MSLAVITIGAVNYDVYATNTEADDYLAADIKRAVIWDALTEGVQDQCIGSATRYLDSFSWDGEPVDGDIPDTQPNQWPRTGLVDRNGTAVPSVGIPQELEDATIIFAYELSQSPTLADSSDTSDNVKRVKAGSVEIEKFRSESGTGFSFEPIFDLVGLWLAGNFSDAIFAFVSGTDVATQTGRPFERSRGFP